MALDDFTPEPEAASGARPEEVNPLLEAEEDEDLFDFPPVVAFADEEAGEEEPVVKSPPAFLDEFDDGLADRAAPSEEPVPALAGETQESARSTPAVDDLPLDADLGFASDDGPVDDTLRRISELEAEFDPTPPRSPAAAAPVPQPVQVVAAPAPAPGGWTKVVIAAAAAVLLLEIGLVGAMWQANRSFATALLEVHAERDSEPRAAAPAGAEPTAVTPGITPAVSPGVERPAGVPTTTPEAIPAEDELALSLAEEEIRNGKYSDARRRLRRLLATIDRVDERRRERVAAEAAYRIAETYRLEAEAQEERR